MSGIIKNLSEAKLYARSIYISFCFDNNYNYEGNIEVEGENGEDFFGEDMKPLQNSKMYLYAKVPNEVAKKYKTCTVTFGFAKNFESWPSQEKDCDYLYKITIKP